VKIPAVLLDPDNPGNLMFLNLYYRSTPWVPRGYPAYTQMYDGVKLWVPVSEVIATLVFPNTLNPDGMAGHTPSKTP
jgi:hypothetical protein